MNCDFCDKEIIGDSDLVTVSYPDFWMREANRKPDSHYHKPCYRRHTLGDRGFQEMADLSDNSKNEL